jgi:transposase
MEEGGLVLKAKDEQRIEVLLRVEAGHLSVVEAAGLLRIGERQVRRLLVSYRQQGPRGVVHGNRGRPPAHAVSDELRQRIQSLATGHYAGVNHSHLAELLAEREGIVIPRSTLSDILREANIRSPRPQRRRSRHRSRRERYPQEGMLLQIDASHHDWLQGRGPRMVILAVIDDATGKVPAARFHDTEDGRGYFLLLRDLCRKTGVPLAIYSDKHSIFWPTQGETLKEQLAGRRSSTQFGRAMSELGIQLIAAHSPQAKGRVERLWGTFQDRLVSELRIAGITTMEEANAYLPGFLARFNRTFAVDAATPGSAYGPRRKAAELEHILCFKHERVVSKDNLVKLDQVVLQLLPGPKRLGYSQATVTIHESLEHRFTVHYQGRQLPSKLVPLRKLLTPKPRPKVSGQSKVMQLPHIPPPTHPWKRYPAVTKSLGT